MWKLLIAEDNFLNRKLMTAIFKEIAECDMAANGKEAVEAYNLSIRSGAPYDAILLDIAMPVMDGLEVLRKIRENEKQAGILLGQGVPIIMVTAYKDPLLSAFSAGCDDYLVKPFKPEALVAKLESVIQKRKS